MLKNESSANGFGQSPRFTKPLVREVTSVELSLTHTVLFLYEPCVESATISPNAGLYARPRAAPGTRQQQGLGSTGLGANVKSTLNRCPDPAATPHFTDAGAAAHGQHLHPPPPNYSSSLDPKELRELRAMYTPGCFGEVPHVEELNKLWLQLL